MPQFKVVGTIIKVIDNKFLIKVDDDYYQIVAAIKESIKDPNTSGHFLGVNFKRARFDIKNLDWSEPTDLIGVRVSIQCDHNTRNIRQQIDVPKEVMNYVSDYVFKTVISYSARSIQNIQ